MTSHDSEREQLQHHYAAAASASARGEYETARELEVASGCSCGPTGTFGAPLYDVGIGAPRAAVEASLGCGVPTAVADLSAGETVLDLGSGAGADVFISAHRVGTTGMVYGLDMTDEMLDLARRNQGEAGIENVEFRKGTIEHIPLPDDSVDVIISNCVINLSTDKAAVFNEAARVLRRGGRFAVTDIVSDSKLPGSARDDGEDSTSHGPHALTRQGYRDGLTRAGFEDIEIRDTHRVHSHAVSAIIRARLS